MNGGPLDAERMKPGRMNPGGSRRDSALRVRQLVIKEAKQLLRDPKTRAIMFVSPLIQLVLFGYAVNTDVRDVSTFVVDHDVTARSRLAVDALTASGYFRVVGTSDRPADLTFALDRGDARVGVWIPSGFAKDLAAGQAHIQLAIDGTNSNTGTVALGYAGRILRRFGTDYVVEQVGDVPRGIDLRARAWFNPDLSSSAYNVPAVIGMLLMLMALLLTALAVVREREMGTLEQLMVSPLSSRELILGKTIPVAVVCMIDLVLVTTVAILWFGVPFRGTLFALGLASLVYIVAGLGFGLIISTVSQTQQEAFMSMFLFFLPAIILSGFLYPVDTMPVFFQNLSLLNPVRHFIEIVRGVFLKGDGVGELARQYVVLTGMAAGSLWVASHRFKKSLA